MKKATTRKKAARKIAPLPLSRARTAYGLVMDAAKAIREEPRRADMRVYVGKRAPSKNGPACGTVGCFAGWLTILAGRDGRPGQDLWLNDETAKDLLGRNVNYNTAGAGAYVFNDGAGDACAETKPGTQDHADAVVARIKQFATVNEKALKAQRLVSRNGRLYGPDEYIKDDD